MCWKGEKMHVICACAEAQKHTDMHECTQNELELVALLLSSYFEKTTKSLIILKENCFKKY